MTYPLEELLREDQEFDWIEECNMSFETQKEASRSTHPKVSKLVDQIPCTHQRTRPSNRSNPNSARK